WIANDLYPVSHSVTTSSGEVDRSGEIHRDLVEIIAEFRTEVRLGRRRQAGETAAVWLTRCAVVICVKQDVVAVDSTLRNHVEGHALCSKHFNVRTDFEIIGEHLSTGLVEHAVFEVVGHLLVGRTIHSGKVALLNDYGIVL